MSVTPERHPLNASGKYYVDRNRCIGQECCVNAAPDNFRMDAEEYGAYVTRQPDGPAEEAQCRQALAECPVWAIRDDGES